MYSKIMFTCASIEIKMWMIFCWFECYVQIIDGFDQTLHNYFTKYYCYTFNKTYHKIYMTGWYLRNNRVHIKWKYLCWRFTITTSEISLATTPVSSTTSTPAPTVLSVFQHLHQSKTIKSMEYFLLHEF